MKLLINVQIYANRLADGILFFPFGITLFISVQEAKINQNFKRY
ncbi:hypothetical protein HMPREF9129_1169 [Peptoniphilus indolicus ATCC 29427]|uniref:Uncharacterized protein n=1 Tax=Peptoniphilus indolicus ATCC 29427 TaxID=997350 RepID=G4D439_9FIRM|nr:hypothetical protein HMPREF9129_1169 [Peptoniphilus indolicus ATCC 29427]